MYTTRRRSDQRARGSYDRRSDEDLRSRESYSPDNFDDGYDENYDEDEYDDYDDDNRSFRGRRSDDFDDEYEDSYRDDYDEYDEFDDEDYDTGRSSRGFASMNRDDVRELSRMAGRVSRPVRSRDYESTGRERSTRYDTSRRSTDGSHNSNRPNSHDRHNTPDSYRERDNTRSGNSRRGFAAMPREEVRRIGARGGRASNAGNENYRSHSGDRSSSRGRNYGGGRSNESNSGNSRGNSERSRRGFASMPRNEVRSIASRGGRASHRGSSEYRRWNDR